MVQPVPTKAVLQPGKAAAMCTTCHDYACPPPFISPFLLAQDLSSKQIALTDKMRPKSDNAKNHHQWLKGYYWIINKHSSEAEYSETTRSYQLIHNIYLTAHHGFLFLHQLQPTFWLLVNKNNFLPMLTFLLEILVCMRRA